MKKTFVFCKFTNANELVIYFAKKSFSTLFPSKSVGTNKIIKAIENAEMTQMRNSKKQGGYECSTALKLNKPTKSGADLGGSPLSGVRPPADFSNCLQISIFG